MVPLSAKRVTKEHKTNLSFVDTISSNILVGSDAVKFILNKNSEKETKWDTQDVIFKIEVQI